MKCQKLLAIAFVVGATLLLSPQIFAQANPEVSNCEEIKDEATQTQKGFCEAHIGCRLVYGIQAGCTNAKSFLNRLGDAIKRPPPADDMNEPKQTSVFDNLTSGVKKFFGGKKDDNPIEPRHVFEAATPVVASERESKDTEWQQAAQRIRSQTAKAERNEVKGQDSDGRAWVYIGDTRFGQPQGWGTKFYNDGTVQQGQFEQGQIKGAGDSLDKDGRRRTGNFESGQIEGKGFDINAAGESYKGDMVAGRRQGQGTLIQADGSRTEASWNADQINGAGIKYRPDGTIAERGLYRAGSMATGQRFDSAGQAIAANTSNIYDQAQNTAQAQQVKERQIAEAKREQEERDKAAQKAIEDRRLAQEQAYRNSLNTMNAGQLFAKADELSSSGDNAKAQEVRRALVSRFPNHPLATQVAAQMSGESGNRPSQATASTSSSNTEAERLANEGSKAYGRGDFTTARKLLQELAAKYPNSPQAFVLKPITSALSDPKDSSSSGSKSTGNCEADRAAQARDFENLSRTPTPEGATPMLMRVMWMTSEAIKLLKSSCPSTPAFQQEIAGYEKNYREAETACNQMSAAKCAPNSYR
jgi:hypothetical protein